MRVKDRDLVPIGDYSLHAMRMVGEDQDFTSIFCTSDASPVMLDINYPDPQALEEGAESAVYYALSWPSTLPIKGVIETIRQVGEGRAQGGYRYMPGGDLPVLTVEFPRVFDEKELKIRGSESGDSSLVEAYQDGFKQLYFVCPELLFTWSGEDELYPDVGVFGLRTGDNGSLTEPFIGELVRRTIAAEHVGGVAVALETLEVVFERYKNQSPALFIN